MVKNSFTLIELLIVVAIIGILSMIAVPVFQKAVLRAQYAEVIGDLKVTGDAMHRLFMDYNDGMVPHILVYHLIPSGPNNEVAEIKGAGLTSTFWRHNTWRILTTPIPYLHENPTSPWDKWNETPLDSEYYNYKIATGYVNILKQFRNLPYSISREKTAEKGWYVGSKGPSNQSNLYGDMEKWFNPTNGLYSDGCVWYDYTGRYSW